MADGVCEICGLPDETWLAVRAVAAHFKCTDKKVRRMLKSGELHGVRFGGVWLVDHASLDDYIGQHSFDPGSGEG